jgi:hypothetical protein
MVASFHDVPGNHIAQHGVPTHAAATATELVTIFRAPFDCKIVSVEIIPDAAITGADTNETNVNLINAGTGGAGTTELANIDFVSGTNGVAGTAIDLYSPTDALALDAGTVLQLQLEKVGTGLALPRFLAIVTYQGA